MLKKISLFVMALGLLLTTSCLGKVSKTDLADLVGNVFGIQSMTTMMSVYGMALDSAVLEMSEDETSGTMTYDNFSISELLLTMGATEDDMATVPLDTMSGSVAVAADGSMEFNVTMTGAVCEELFFNFNGETQKITNLKADGKEYDINEALEKLSAKREKEAAKEQAEAEAALPKVQTVQ